jgi:hypothetical protein
MTDMIGNFTNCFLMDNFQEKMRRGKAVTTCESLLGAVDAATCGEESVGNPLVHRFDGNLGCSLSPGFGLKLTIPNFDIINAAPPLLGHER